MFEPSLLETHFFGLLDYCRLNLRPIEQLSSRLLAPEPSAVASGLGGGEENFVNGDLIREF